MNTASIQETELVTRSIARWGSAAAAIIFGVAFATDNLLDWHIVSSQFVHILLVVTIFVGYAIAWTKRFEVLGSVIALAAMIGVFVYVLSQGVPSFPEPAPIFLAVGAPALFHLVAVMLHRYDLSRPMA